MASNGSAVWGCGPNVDSLYYNLCDLAAAWGVVLEALAAAGVVLGLVLLIALLASIPFMTDPNRRSSLGLHAGFLVFTLGLFGLTFAFIVGKDFATCASRRFLFGVLFAGCFSCLLVQAVKVNILARRGRGPPAWALCLGAAGLWLVEVIINTEWIIITVVRYPQAPPNTTAAPVARAEATPCNIANQDFATALIYVMVLIVAVVVAGLASTGGKDKRWRCEGACILLMGLLSAGIWAAWIAMYVYGNRRSGGGPSWDDPTLAIALVASGWAFLLLHTVPEVCCWGAAEESQQNYAEDLYPSRGVGYETILKEQTSQNMFMENKAFSMEEPGPGNKGLKPVSPYSGYSGQLRNSVYQPTELAFISKGVVSTGSLSVYLHTRIYTHVYNTHTHARARQARPTAVSVSMGGSLSVVVSLNDLTVRPSQHQTTDLPFDTIIPRAAASSPAHSDRSTGALPVEMGGVHNRQPHGNSVGSCARAT
ncbi:hypothetical protein NHX12_025173 [Muraenolepis orangiensis]|uniref:G-protein coupled receptors family 3 profile domain-containing protein n=1 Tax=Muraenolepis orangiensis TaxID=630683 RepID=A0A9Q0EKQ9_9TELE|nr:hypothetical protein NHX12_025173 [Muraenolepis orangiensis]